MINFNTFLRLFAEAKKYAEADAYIRGIGWNDEWMHSHSVDDIVALLRYTYNCAHDGIHAILCDYKSLKQLAASFAVPYGTAQKWKSGECTPAEYTIIMMAYITFQSGNVAQKT